MSSPRWSNFTKILIISALAIFALVLLVTFRGMIAPTIVAFLLTFVLNYPVNWVQQRTGWSRTASVITIYAGMMVVLALVPVWVVPRLLSLTSSLSDTLLELIEDLRTSTAGPLFTFGGFRLTLNNLLQETGTIVRGVLSVFADSPGSLVRSVTTGVVTTVYTLVLNFWLLKDLNLLKRFLFDQVPLDYQEEIRRLGDELSQIWQAFLQGQLIVAIITGIVVWIPLAIVGMPNAGGLALLAGVMEFLPSIGPAISGTIGTMSALFQGSNWMPIGNLPFAILVGAIYGIIGQVEGVYFIPRFVGGRVKLHPAVTFAAIINGALAFGVLGILLAAPVVASSRIIFNYIYRKLNDLEPFEPRTSQTTIRIPGLIAGRKIEGIIFELEGVLSKPDQRIFRWSDQQFDWLDGILSPTRRHAILQHTMVLFEGFINFTVSQLWRLQFTKQLTKLQPIFDLLRSYPEKNAYEAQPSISELLHTLSHQYELGLVTTRPRSDIEKFLEKNGLNEGLFQVILTRDDVRHLLPHHDALVTAASQMRLQPDQILMVSDTDVNLRAARAMEMATAGVLCGLGWPGSHNEADFVAQSTVDLLEWL